MAGTQLNFEISGLSAAQAYMAEITRRAEDTSVLMQAIAHEGMQQTLRRFDAQKDPEGKAWLPSMAARRENRKTLIDTRHFRDETFSSEATNDQAIWGTNAIQGRIFQFGGTIMMKPRQGKTRLRLNRNGTLMRQSQIDRIGPFTPRQLALQSRAAVFAKRSHKSAKSVDFNVKGYAIHVVARPFLGVNEADRKTFDAMIGDYFFDGMAPS